MERAPLFTSAVTTRGRKEAAVEPSQSPAAYDPDQDPVITDPDKYVALFENETIRVLRYRDEPGARTHPHAHPNAVLYALSSFRRRITFADGTRRERSFKPGDVMWLTRENHIGENVGTTPTDVLLIELKGR